MVAVAQSGYSARLWFWMSRVRIPSVTLAKSPGNQVVPGLWHFWLTSASGPKCSLTVANRDRLSEKDAGTCGEFCVVRRENVNIDLQGDGDVCVPEASAYSLDRLAGSDEGGCVAVA